MAIRHRLTLDGSEDERRGNRQAVLRSPAETALFADHPGAVAETVRLAERLEFDLTRDLGYRFPDFAGSHPGETAQEALTRVCLPARRALPQRGQRREARARLDRELALIAHHDLAGFFLLHRDILELAREVALRTRPAGSARRYPRARARVVGGVDRLLPHRPLPRRPGRERPLPGPLPQPRHGVGARHRPRLPPRRAGGLIEEVIARYGAEHAALVAAFPTFRIRMAIRELGGALAPLRPTWKAWRGCRTPGRRRGRSRRSSPGCPTARPSSPRRAGGRWPSSRATPPACRGTSPSTPGGWSSARPLVELVPVVPAAFRGARSASGTRTPAPMRAS